MLFANNFFIPGGGLMAGYSYFDYNQMTLLEIEVHSDDENGGANAKQRL